MPVAATCKRCNAPIIWAKTRAGKSVPLDAKPVPLDAKPNFYGNVLLHADGEASVLSTQEIDILPPPRPLLYVSHFVTCPQANQHRKPKESAPVAKEKREPADEPPNLPVLIPPPEVKKPKGMIVADAELVTMQKINRLIAKLPDDRSKQRVIAWLKDKLEFPLAPKE